METSHLIQIAILAMQCVLVSALILLLFRLRGFFGIAPLYAALGLFQYMQVFLASAFYIEVAESVMVSPGSTVLFTGSLFMVLLIYIKEDTQEVRRIIYALLIANILMSILLLLFSWHFNRAEVFSPFGITPGLFTLNARIFLAGTLTLFMDALLIIVLYEWISRMIQSLFFRMILTMALVVTFDTLSFTVLAFGGSGNLWPLLVSGFVSKNGAVLVYGFLFFVYLKIIDNRAKTHANPKLKDIFSTLSYRQKFELVKQEKEYERAKAEKAIQLSRIKYETLTTISPVGIFLTDPDGYTSYVNPRWCEISGLSQEEALGFGWLKAVHPDDREKIRQGWSAATLENSESTAEYRFVLSDGRLRWVLGNATPELDPDGTVIGYVGTITDITGIKEYEEKLSRAKEKAEESDRLKSAFLMNMSHEIRTPMNGILGFLDLLRNPELDQSQASSYIDIVNKSGQRLLETINDILELSKIEAGEAELRLEVVNLEELMCFQLDFFQPQVRERGIFLKIDRQLKGEEALVYADRGKLDSILTNLIRNAIKFTKKGSITFGNTLRNNRVVFYVTDTGIGIPQDRIPVIFDRFIHADMGITREHEGSGLGLAIVKAYVQAMDGDIQVDSVVGQGSTFTFSVPYQEAVSSGDGVRVADIPGSSDKPLLLGKTILVAEDDEYSFIYLQTLLEREGVSLVHCLNGKETVDVLRKKPDIDLVLMDIKMPVMDGLEATRLIREFRPEIPIIAQTAYAIAGDRKKAIDAGCNDYLTKPIRKGDLEALIGEYLKSASDRHGPGGGLSAGG